MDPIPSAVFLSAPSPRWLPRPNPEGFLWLPLWDTHTQRKTSNIWENLHLNERKFTQKMVWLDSCNPEQQHGRTIFALHIGLCSVLLSLWCISWTKPSVDCHLVMSEHGVTPLWHRWSVMGLASNGFALWLMWVNNKCQHSFLSARLAKRCPQRTVKTQWPISICTKHSPTQLGHTLRFAETSTLAHFSQERLTYRRIWK